MWLIKLFLLCLLFISPYSIAKNKLVYYQPQSIELEGFIKILTYPGAPNYESIKNGDTVEKGAYLILKAPIDIDYVPHIELGNDEPEKNVKILQLVIYNDNYWKKAEEGYYVSIKGTLFRAVFAHHHSRVLLEVKNIQVLPKRKMAANDLTITKEDYDKMGDPQQKPAFKFKVIN